MWLALLDCKQPHCLKDRSESLQCWHSGFVAASYSILRAFSWQIRLSPVPFEELCAAIVLPQPSALLDELFLCVLRALAQDENKAGRASRVLDLSLLDTVTWPEYVWEWLRLTGNPLNCHCRGHSVNANSQVSH